MASGNSLVTYLVDSEEDSDSEQSCGSPEIKVKEEAVQEEAVQEEEEISTEPSLTSEVDAEKGEEPTDDNQELPENDVEDIENTVDGNAPIIEEVDDGLEQGENKTEGVGRAFDILRLSRDAMTPQLEVQLRRMKEFFTKQTNLERVTPPISKTTADKVEERLLCKYGNFF